jgi:hypothetical protein
MGNVTISTTETEIYYPSDWLVDGGPPPAFMGCPPITSQILNEESAMNMVKIVWEDFGQNSGRWNVIAGHPDSGEAFIVMQSTNYKDVATYFAQYMAKFERWLGEGRCR